MPERNHRPACSGVVPLTRADAAVVLGGTQTVGENWAPNLRAGVVIHAPSEANGPLIHVHGVIINLITARRRGTTPNIPSLRLVFFSNCFLFATLVLYYSSKGFLFLSVNLFSTSKRSLFSTS